LILSESIKQPTNSAKERKDQFTIHACVALASSLVTGAFIYAALLNDWGVGLVAATLVPAAFAARSIWAAVRSARDLSLARGTVEPAVPPVAEKGSRY
jgi:hypothetical protein